MPDPLADVLRCPVCQAPLRRAEGTNGAPPSLRCPAGHRFDAARQGYFNLLTGRGTGLHADTAEMVAARAAFLARGHYTPLADAVAHQVKTHRTRAQPDAGRAGYEGSGPGRMTVLDAGAGTGYYLQEVHRLNPGLRSVALDISKFALRRAARAVPETVALVWDVWRPLPLAAGSADVVLNIFAPRNAPEFARVLNRHGLLVVATPSPGHLAEIAAAAGLLGFADNKAAALRAALAGNFHQHDELEISYTMALAPADITDAALMGPAAHHLDRKQLAAAAEEAPAVIAVSARFTVQVFRPVAG